MPSTDQIKKAQDRRAAREGKKAANVQAAADQEHELAALSDRLRGVSKPDPDAQFNEAGLRVDQVGMADPIEGADGDGFHRSAAPAVKGSKADQKAARQAAAAAQAEIDVQATVNPLPEQDEHDLSYYRSRNIDPPLHVLNAIARRADDGIKDDARVAAQAAGKAAYEALTDHRNNRSPESRHRKVEQAMRAAAASKSQVGAADPAKE